MEDLKKKVTELQWFHAIDFGDFCSAGRFRPGTPQNITLYGTFEYLSQLDMSEASVLDLGTYDGIVAFGADALSANKVTAVDTFRNEAFLVARKLLGLENKIRYEHGIQVRDLAELFPPKHLDVIICAGIFYHMLHPMQAFTECRKVLGDGGVLILETPYDASREDAVLVFNGVEHVVNEPYTYFVPSLSALTGMANLAGFKVVATRVLTAPKRVTLLLKASSRDQLIADDNTPSFVGQMLKRDTCDNEFRHKELEKTTRQSPTIIRQDSRLEAYREITAANEIVDFPYHADPSKPQLGTTRFEQADGNTLLL